MNIEEGIIFGLFGITITVIGFCIAYHIGFKKLEEEKRLEEERKKPKIFNDDW